MSVTLQNPLDFEHPLVNPLFRLMGKHFQHNGTSAPGYVVPQKKIRRSTLWLNTLQEGCKFQVSDPRDRVYAVLGMLQSPSTRLYVSDAKLPSKAPFPIDYNKSISVVYQDFMKFLINMDRNLDCLCYFEKPRSMSFDLPSWVVDWRKDAQRSFIEITIPVPIHGDLREVAEQQTYSDVDQLVLEGYTVSAIAKIDGEHSSLLTSRNCHYMSSWFCPPYHFIPTSQLLESSVETWRYVQANTQPLKEMSGGTWHYYVPRYSMLGDEIVVVKGAKLPLVLRPATPWSYRFVGPAVLLFNDRNYLNPEGGKAYRQLEKDQHPIADQTQRYILV